jgi:hypothetical protein
MARGHISDHALGVHSEGGSAKAKAIRGLDDAKKARGLQSLPAARLCSQVLYGRW